MHPTLINIDMFYDVDNFPCPVCGYGLGKPAADFTICPSCGVEFGYSDVGISHRELRQEWISFGAPWSSAVVVKPASWNPWNQLIQAKLYADIPWLNGTTVYEFSTLMHIAEATTSTSEPVAAGLSREQEIGCVIYS